MSVEVANTRNSGRRARSGPVLVWTNPDPRPTLPDGVTARDALALRVNELLDKLDKLEEVKGYLTPDEYELARQGYEVVLGNLEPEPKAKSTSPRQNLLPSLFTPLEVVKKAGDGEDNEIVRQLEIHLGAQLVGAARALRPPIRDWYTYSDISRFYEIPPRFIDVNIIEKGVFKGRDTKTPISGLVFTPAETLYVFARHMLCDVIRLSAFQTYDWRVREMVNETLYRSLTRG